MLRCKRLNNTYLQDSRVPGQWGALQIARGAILGQKVPPCGRTWVRKRGLAACNFLCASQAPSTVASSRPEPSRLRVAAAGVAGCPSCATRQHRIASHRRLIAQGESASAGSIQGTSEYQSGYRVHTTMEKSESRILRDRKRAATSAWLTVRHARQ